MRGSDDWKMDVNGGDHSFFFAVLPFLIKKEGFPEMDPPSF